ncbi:hypothetical protein [Clostridium niameyense]|uniref:hypothetical protein n=1 Tax=Clostridium niameyense TaxID=1622073 RepID=UPI00067E991F|nr:hypothetical protein [Clostridium niameyense]
MIQVFCKQRGFGKTKELINKANDESSVNKGHIVYIDDDNRPMFALDTDIRFINTSEFKVNNCKSFYGFLCGIISEDYDIESIYIDGLFNIITEGICDAAHLFYALETISENHNIDFYININHEEDLPKFLEKYVA